MGLKRPFDEEFPELSFKHSRQGENGDRVSAFEGKLTSFDSTPQKPNISGDFEKGFQKLQWCDIHVDQKTASDFETSAPFSWITTSFSEDHAGIGPTAYTSRSSEDIEFNFPRRAVVSFEDVYSSHSPRPTRKQVPIGPYYQAIIPVCGNDDNSYEERLMGTSIIPMPDLTSPSSPDENIGAGRGDCSCLDMGSVRCVRQHIMEAREKLRDTLGQEKFTGLGFNDMGEELAKKWSEEEEHVFHEVVYSSPSRNFWKNLSSMFPSRSKGEIVSYYFNVFMLRRRAAQNRSKFLEIDSDDDEWHDCVGGDHPEHDFGSPEDDHDEDSDDDSDDGDGDVSYTPKELGNMFGSETHRSPGSYDDSFDAQYNSCMSFEGQGSNSAESSGTVDDAERNKPMPSKIEKASDGMGLIYMLENCESKNWDIRYPSDPVKGVDLLPTCNMIEEIFGQGTWDGKKMDDH